MKHPMAYGLFMLAALLLLASLAACCPDPIVQREMVTVEVPVLTKSRLPPAIVDGVEVALPEFIAPCDPVATSALTEEGERRLKTMLLTIMNLRTAVREWNETD